MGVVVGEIECVVVDIDGGEFVVVDYVEGYVGELIEDGFELVVVFVDFSFGVFVFGDFGGDVVEVVNLIGFIDDGKFVDDVCVCVVWCGECVF